MDAINSIIQLQPSYFTEDPERIQIDLQTLLNLCGDCQNFKQISTKSFNLRNIFPCAYEIIKLILVSPISSSSCERSFSKLKMVMNSLRSTMGDERLDSLMLLFTSKDIVDKISLSQIVEKWSTLKHRLINT